MTVYSSMYFQVSFSNANERKARKTGPMPSSSRLRKRTERQASVVPVVENVFLYLPIQSVYIRSVLLGWALTQKREARNFENSRWCHRTRQWKVPCAEKRAHTTRAG